MMKRITLLILVSIILLTSVTCVSAYSGSENGYNVKLVTAQEFSDTSLEDTYQMAFIANPSTSGLSGAEGDYEVDLNVYSKGVGGKYAESEYELYIVPQEAFYSYTTDITANDPSVINDSDDTGEITQNGTDVEVVDDGVSVTFENVTESGNTTVTAQTGNPVSSEPSGFMFRGYFVDISTTATYTGNIEVCIDYTGIISGNEDKLRLMHWDGSWDDVTTSLDTKNNILCGEVTSLSPFGIASTYSEPVGGEVSTVNKIELMLPYVVISALALILGMEAYVLRKQ